MVEREWAKVFWVAELLQPNELSNCVIHGFVFGLYTWSSNNVLFPWTPRDEVVANKNAKTVSGMLIIRATYLVDIRVCMKLGPRVSEEKHTMVDGGFEIPRNSFHDFPMKNFWFIHKLIHFIYCKGDIEWEKGTVISQ